MSSESSKFDLLIMNRCEPPTKPTLSPPYPNNSCNNVGKGSSQESCSLAIMDPAPGEDKTLKLNPQNLNESQCDPPCHIHIMCKLHPQQRDTLPYLPPASKINHWHWGIGNGIGQPLAHHVQTAWFNMGLCHCVLPQFHLGHNYSMQPKLTTFFILCSCPDNDEGHLVEVDSNDIQDGL